MVCGKETNMLSQPWRTMVVAYHNCEKIVSLITISWMLFLNTGENQQKKDRRFLYG